MSDPKSDQRPDLRAIAVTYRDDLLEEIARLDAFIEWADQMASTGGKEILELCVLTEPERPHFLH